MATKTYTQWWLEHGEPAGPFYFSAFEAGFALGYDRGHSELETVLDAAIAYRESQRAYNEGTLKERVPNGTRINECQAALDAAITAVKGNNRQ